MKDLARFYGKSTLQHKLISCGNKKRVKMGRTVAHKIGGHVGCVPVRRNVGRGVAAVRGRTNQTLREYKGSSAPGVSFNCPSESLPATPSPSSPSYSDQHSTMSNFMENQSTIISGQGSNLPRVKKILPVNHEVLTPHRDMARVEEPGACRPASSTPVNLEGMLTISTISFPSEVAQALHLVGKFDVLETMIFERLESEEDERCSGILEVHDSLQKGVTLQDSQLPWVGGYFWLVRSALLQARDIIPADQQSPRLRCITRLGGKMERIMACCAKKASDTWGVISAGAVPPPIHVSPEKSKQDVSKEAHKQQGLAFGKVSESGPTGGKRDQHEEEEGEVSRPAPKNLRRSSSFSDVNNTEVWSDSESETSEGVGPMDHVFGGEKESEAVGVENVMEVDKGYEEGVGEDREEDVEHEETDCSSEDREHLSTIEASMKAGTVCFDALDSDDGEDGRATSYADQRWAMVSAARRFIPDAGAEAMKSFVMGPTTPDTNNYLVVGSTPMVDKKHFFFNCAFFVFLYTCKTYIFRMTRVLENPRHFLRNMRMMPKKGRRASRWPCWIRATYSETSFRDLSPLASPCVTQTRPTKNGTLGTPAKPFPSKWSCQQAITSSDIRCGSTF